MPPKITYTPSQGPFVQKKKPHSTISYSLWMEDEYSDGYNDIRSGNLEIFTSVFFEKKYLLELINAPDCHWVMISPVVLHQQDSSLCSLWAVGANTNAVPLLGETDQIVISGLVGTASNKVFPEYGNKVNSTQLFPFSTPADLNPDEFTSKIPEFTDRSLQQLIVETIGGGKGKVNPFLGVHILKDDLRKICEQDNCDQVAFMPIELDWEVKKDLIPDRSQEVFEFSTQTGISLMILAIDPDGHVLPQKDNGVDQFAYIEDVWPPVYRPWQ